MERWSDPNGKSTHYGEGLESKAACCIRKDEWLVEGLTYSFSAYYLVTSMICTGNYYLLATVAHSLLFLFWSRIDADCGDRPSKIV
jgi:hypothetical protein